MMPRDPSFFRTRVLREAKRMQGAASVEAQIAHHGMLSAYVDQCRAVADSEHDCAHCEAAPLCRAIAQEDREARRHGYPAGSDGPVHTDLRGLR